MILQISAFYMNDQPGGVGITLSENCDEVWNAIENSYRQMWVDAVEADKERELVGELFAQLNAIGQKDQATTADALVVLGNVWLLEQNHYLEPDDFNGMQFVTK